jgi:dihydroorotate dehydrogenase electron transfer subunit
MEKALYTILSNELIADKTYRMRLQGPTGALKRAGQFVDVAIDGFFLRRPLAAQEWDPESLAVIYKVVGQGTEVMSAMQPGQALELLCGLGNGFNAGACRQSALIACGGLGASPVFSLAKELIAQGKKVCVVMGFNTAADAVLVDDFKAMGADVHLATLDGSLGIKGFVTDAIKAVQPEFDYFYTCGPAPMMKAVCASLEGPGEASLEERMGCGCGICYGCTCHTASGPKRVCADGPVFKKEDIIW